MSTKQAEMLFYNEPTSVMALWFIFFFIVYFQVANSQYYTVPASSYHSCYPSFVASSPTTYASNLQPRSLSMTPVPKTLKRSVKNTAVSGVKCSPPTASAYFLKTPTEKVKSVMLGSEPSSSLEQIKEKVIAKSPVPYSCPLCNNFADVPKSSKISPPPPIGSSVLPGIIDKVPTIAIPNSLTTKDPKLLKDSKILFADMCEKNKVPQNLRFDQELLEGFLTGLGIAS